MSLQVGVAKRALPRQCVVAIAEHCSPARRAAWGKVSAAAQRRRPGVAAEPKSADRQLMREAASLQARAARARQARTLGRERA